MIRVSSDFKPQGQIVKIMVPLFFPEPWTTFLQEKITAFVGRHPEVGSLSDLALFDWPKLVASLSSLQSFVASHVARTLCNG